MSTYTETYDTDPFVSPARVTVTAAANNASVGAWSWDSTNKALQQTSGSTSNYLAFQSSMPRSANKYIDVSADVTLVSDASGRRHFGFFLQGVDGTTPSGYRVTFLDGTAIASRWDNGSETSLGSTNYAGWSIGQTKRFRVIIDSTGKGFSYLDGTQVHTWVDTAYQNLRPGFHVYGANVRWDNVTYLDQLETNTDLSGQTIQSLTSRAGFNYIGFSWAAMTAASKYQYQIDGGAWSDNNATSVILTGLAAGNHTFVVRAANNMSGTFSQTATASKAPIITANDGFYSAVVADNPTQALEFEETAGAFLDYTTNQYDMAYNSGTRGAPPNRATSGASVASVGTYLGRRADTLPCALGTTFSVEMWLAIPTGNVAGVFYGAGQNNGWSVGIGASNSMDNPGRYIGIISNAVAWGMSNYQLPDNGSTQLFHIIWTYNANAWTFYVNGVQVATVNQSVSSPTVYSTLGALTESGSLIRQITSGIRLDSVYLYPTTLSAARVTAHFNGGTVITGSSVTSLNKIEFNGGAYVTWNSMAGADGYQYRINGGSPVTVTKSKATITGLTNDTQATVEVRGTKSSDSSVSQWASVNVKPTSLGLLFDDFDRAAVAPSANALGSPVQGPAWPAQQVGVAGINANGMLYTNVNQENRFFQPQGSYNIDITASMCPDDNGLMFRVRDINNYWMLHMTGGFMRIYRYNGTFNVLVDYAQGAGGSASCVAGTLYLVRVIAVGESVRVYINGLLKFEFQDQIALSTDIGFGHRVCALNALVDFVSVRTPDDLPNPSGILVPSVASGSIATTLPPTSWAYKGRDTKVLDTGSVS